jgi:hypothetical protein
VAVISVLDPRLWLVVIFIAIATFFAGKYDEHRVTAALDNEAQQVLKDANDRADSAEQKILSNDKEAKRAKEKEIAIINRAHAITVAGLQQRLARRADAGAAGTGTIGQCAGASGAELSKEDGRFLAGEASRADRYVIELNACNARYDGVAEQINRMTTKQ